jgi:hypothetical protein
MKITKNRARLLAVVLGCAALGALLTAGPASAASRGYKLHNLSDNKLKLDKAARLPKVLCNGSICVPTESQMAFEGRPDNGDVLNPGKVHSWELKYSFGDTYAARLSYDIVGMPGASVEWTIETSTFSNDSACKVVPASAGKCTAEGLKLTFK